jgi:signal transduction histidine kinase/CheY-like chemotaxis protein
LQRLLRSEIRLDDLMNHWPGIVFRQRLDFSFDSISPQAEELTGIPSSKLLSQPGLFWEMVHEGDAESLAARLGSQEQSADGASTTYRIRHAQTGRVTHLWEYRRAIRKDDGSISGSEGLWLDVTGQTLAERRLLHMLWRENLGILTMGLVHDFCNILTGIVGLSEAFQSNSQLDEPLRNGMGLIHQTAMRGNQLAQRMRQLHQEAPGERTYCDLNETVRLLLELLEKVLPRRVRVKTELVGGQLPVYADQVALQQVLVNLALNGADAMPDGGELVFQTGRHANLPDTLNLQGSRPRTPAISLSVRDSGTGIPARFLNSIFEAFASTKPLGKGSGLGLYSARLFVEKHNAAISVETKEGQGSTFHLWFSEANFREAQSSPEGMRRTRHTLLVAGPPGDALEKLSALLRENGYYVVPATDETGALEALYAPQFELTGLIVIASEGDSDEISLCERVRAHKLPMKTMLVLTKASQPDREERLLGTVDAVVPADIAPQDLLTRLRSLLSPT